MIKRGLYYTALMSLVAFISLAFKPDRFELEQCVLNQNTETKQYVFPSKNTNTYFANTIPFIGKYFIGFKEAIGFKESQGQYTKINTLGYMGKYQFGKTTLESVGVKDSLTFLNSPKLQEKAFIALLQKNKYILQETIKTYSGKTINGILVTESGILAAAHLGGAGSVRKYLQTNGACETKDQYGTTIGHYLKEFGGFETKNIKPKRNAKV